MTLIVPDKDKQRGDFKNRSRHQNLSLLVNMKTTKQLAKELGLLRKRSKSSASQNIKRIRKTCQIFSYLIVLDFESTCWPEKYRTQEIIEFPAVLLNTSTGEIESEFHFYVQPQENPTLSHFCKELTGITQEQVDEGIPLSLCLSRFNAWLTRLRIEKGLVYNDTSQPSLNTCTFVTWSDWDLGVCLQYECRRKQLRKPLQLCAWIDLRATYRKFYDRKPKGLEGALKDLGIEFEGRQHSGLDDARNTSHLAWRMMCDGCVMKITKSQQPVGGSRFISAPLRSNSVGPGSGQADLNNRDGEAMRSNRVTPGSGQADLNNRDTEEMRSNRVAPTLGHLATTASNSHHNGITTVGSTDTKVTNQTKNQRQIMSVPKPDKLSRAETSQAIAARLVTPASCMSNPFSSIKHKQSFVADSSVKCSSGVLFKTPCEQRLPSNHPGTLSRQDISKPVLHKTVPHFVAKEKGSNISRSNKNEAVFKVPTPPQTILSNNRSYGSYKTPQNSTFTGKTSGHSSFTEHGEKLSLLKKTPPMCECGRRSHRKFVQSPGPNMGRAFYCCPKGKRRGSGDRQGCQFFKWENQTSGGSTRSRMNMSRTSSEGSLFDLSNNSRYSNSSLSSSSLSPNIISPESDSISGRHGNPLQPIPQPNFNTPSNTSNISGAGPGKKTLGTKFGVLINPFKK